MLFRSDGTTNYLHGFPVFCVSIGVARRGELEHGVVYDPLRQEIFTASRGQGAQLDGRRIRVSKRTTLQQSLVATGFPYRANLMHLDRYMQMLRTVMLESSGVRRPGSAALDLCYVAAGRIDAFFEFGLSNCSAECDVPQRRCFALVRLATFEIAKECALRHSLCILADGLVSQLPVNTHTEATPQVLECLFVLKRQAHTQFNKVATRNCDGIFAGFGWWLERSVVGQ